MPFIGEIGAPLMFTSEWTLYPEAKSPDAVPIDLTIVPLLKVHVETKW
jgi:hypothetical protein